MKYHLAQLNIARLKAALDDPSLHGFVSKLDEINALADSSPGFVWRLLEDLSSTGGVSIIEDQMYIVNMSVWESIEDLKHFVYKTAHVKVYLQKDSWFHKMKDHHMVLWWVKEGEIPDLIEANTRLKFLQKKGPGKYAFTFNEVFEAPKP